MQRIAASSVVLLLASYVILSFFVPCPFFSKSSDSASSMPCCPRQSDDAAKHCPLSESIETCPFYVTESKIGIASAFVIPVSALPLSSGPHIGSIDIDLHSLPQVPASGVDTYLRNRVLLI